MKADTAPTTTVPNLTSRHIETIEQASGILSAVLHPSKPTLFTASMDGGIQSLDLNSQQKTLIGNHQSYASGVVVGPTPDTLISAGYDGLLIWHDIENKHPIHVIEAHKFWSWRLAISPDQKQVASCTGRYHSGGYRYEPAAESEPSIKIFDSVTGETTHEFEHTPPVTSLAFSPDSRFIAAGNLMGQIRIYELATSRLRAVWTTDAFTSWGIVKSHHYIGGIFDLAFTPETSGLIACGMGPMRDPMAGNGKQTWQCFDWQTEGTPLSREIEPNDAGKGLMETLTIDPHNERFVMAGRLAQGQWNTAIFDTNTGTLLHSLNTKMRTTKALFTNKGDQLILCGAGSQKAPKNGKWPDFGKTHIYQLEFQS